MRSRPHRVEPRIAAALLPLLAALAGVLAPGPAPASGASRLALVPPPRSLTLEARRASMTDRWTILSGREAEDSVAIHLLAAELHDAYGWQAARSPRQGAPVIALTHLPAPADADSLFRQQGYCLTITPRRITISAPSAQGRYYGVQTLRQLVRTSGAASLPCLVIRDAPTLAVRGVSEDISRGQLPTLAAMRATLRELGYYKLNMYQLYIEDVFAFDALARVNPRRDRLTPHELALLTAEAAQHHVVLVPVLQTLGHQERLLASPEFRHLAELKPPATLPAWLEQLRSTFAGGGRSRPVPARDVADGEESPAAVPASLCPVDPNARAFVRGLVSEMCASAEAPFLHCGGDEPADVGKGRSMAEVKRRGFGSVYADYYSDLNRTVRERGGRQMMLYSDVLLAHDDALRAVPRDVVVVDWHYDPQSAFGSLDTLGRAGFRTIACAGLWNWRSFYPAYGRAFENIRGAVRGAGRYGAWGAMVSSWGDGGAECLNDANWAGYAYLAACAWGAIQTDEGAFLRAYALTAFGAGGEPMARMELALGWADLAARPWHGSVFAKLPTVRRRTDAWLAAMTTTRARMREVLKLAAVAKRTVPYNRDRLSVMRHAAERYLFLADREIVLDDIARSLEPQPAGSRDAGDRAGAARQLEDCADRLARLRGNYRALWFGASRPEGLAALNARMLRQEDAFRELARSAREGTLEAWRPRGARPVPGS